MNSNSVKTELQRTFDNMMEGLGGAVGGIVIFHIPISGDGVIRVIVRYFLFSFQRLRVFGVIVEISYHKQTTANDTKHQRHSINFGEPKEESKRKSNNRY